MNTYKFLLFSIPFYVMADIFTKKYSTRYGVLEYVGACVCFLMCSMLWLSAIKEGKSLSTVGTVWNIVIAAITILVGIMGYREQLTPVQWVGLAFGVISIVLMSGKF